jgi:signal peptidase I
LGTRLRWLLLLLGALLLIRGFLVGLVQVRTSSMAPTIQAGDVWAYAKFGDVGVGDIVLVRLPDEPELLHVKRIVATGGQEVELSQGRLYVDGVRLGRDGLAKIKWRDTDCMLQEGRILEEDYAGKGWTVLAGGSHERQRVKAEHFWVLGDNRGSSSDSRHWDAVSEQWIVGRLWRRILSRDRCGEGS